MEPDETLPSDDTLVEQAELTVEQKLDMLHSICREFDERFNMVLNVLGMHTDILQSFGAKMPSEHPLVAIPPTIITS